MAQQRVQFDDVKRAWMQIAFSGGNPTLDAIYKRIGYGSKSTIHKLRQKLLEELQERGVEILPARIPEALVPIIEEFWGHAIAHAGEAFSAERKEYQRDLEEGRVVRAEMQATIDALNGQLNKERLANDQLKQDFAEQEGRLADQESAFRDAQVKISSLETTIQKNAEIHAMERDRLTQGFDHERKEWERDRSHLINERDQAVARANFEIERADSNADHWLRELDEERQSGKRLAESLRDNITRLEQELHLTRQREQGLALRNGKLEDRLYETQNHLSDLQGRYDATQEQHKEHLNQYEQKMAALENELATVTDQLKQLQKPKTDDSDKEEK